MPHAVTDLPRLSVAIVVYNSALPLLAKTLHSLREAADHASGTALGSVTVTIIDNGSEPAYQSQLVELLNAQPELPAVRLIKLSQNIGFGAGHNRALQENCGDYHLVLNPDVEVALQALSTAVAHLQADPATVLVSPHSLGADQQQEFLCKRYPSVLVLALRAFAPGLGRKLFSERLERYEMSDQCAAEETVPVVLASGCFMLVRGRQLTQVGGFDERYFLYFEDFDLSLRLSKLGKLMYVPSVRIVHHGGYAASKGWKHLKMFANSGFRFFQQHGWRWI